jgi:hypothetical protein
MNAIINEFFASIPAPFSIRRETMSMCPFRAAKWRGVHPFLDCGFDESNDETVFCLDFCSIRDKERSNIGAAILSC